MGHDYDLSASAFQLLDFSSRTASSLLDGRHYSAAAAPPTMKSTTDDGQQIRMPMPADEVRESTISRRRHILSAPAKFHAAKDVFALMISAKHERACHFSFRNYHYILLICVMAMLKCSFSMKPPMFTAGAAALTISF